MFNRKDRREIKKLSRQRVRNKSYMTAHPSKKKEAKNTYKVNKDRGIIKTMSNKMKLGILASDPKNGKGLGLLRKIFN